MSTAIAKIVVPDSQLAVPAQEAWPQSRREFIRKNFCGNAPEHIAESFLALCERRGLSPEERHIYLVPREVNKKVGNDWIKTEEYVPQTGIDGYRLIADRTGSYAGSDAPQFHGEGTMSVKIKEFDEESRRSEWKTVQRKHPEMATVTVYKVVKGVRCPFTGAATWDEFNAGTSTWKKMPYVMLSKVAEAQALRKAFPADLSGLFTNEEMDQAGPATETTFREVPKAIDTTSQADKNIEKFFAEPEPTAPTFDERLFEATGATGKKQKDAFNALYQEAIREKDTDKLRLLVKAVPTYDMAEYVMHNAFDKHQLHTKEMKDALDARVDAPGFVDVATGEITDE